MRQTPEEKGDTTASCVLNGEEKRTGRFSYLLLLAIKEETPPPSTHSLVMLVRLSFDNKEGKP